MAEPRSPSHEGCPRRAPAAEPGTSSQVRVGSPAQRIRRKGGRKSLSSPRATAGSRRPGRWESMRAHRTHGRGEASAPVRALDSSLSGVRLFAAVLVVTYVLSLLANAFGARGFLATLAVGGKALFLVGLVVL